MNKKQMCQEPRRDFSEANINWYKAAISRELMFFMVSFAVCQRKIKNI